MLSQDIDKYGDNTELTFLAQLVAQEFDYELIDITPFVFVGAFTSAPFHSLNNIPPKLFYIKKLIFTWGVANAIEADIQVNLGLTGKPTQTFIIRRPVASFDVAATDLHDVTSQYENLLLTTMIDITGLQAGLQVHSIGYYFNYR